MVLTEPKCPDHGDQMLELALGGLDDQQALEAERMREECPRCARQWDGLFNGPAYERVDGAVAEAFQRFEPPARRRRAWLAVAAAAVLAVGVGSMSLFWGGGQDVPQQPGDVVAVWDFEDGNLVEGASLDEMTSDHVDEPIDEDSVFASDLESGDLSSWTFHS